MIKGVGIDIIRISRVEKVYSAHGERFLKRVFSDEEIKYISRSRAKFIERIASTFSAKEAVFKTIGMRRPIIFKEIEIIRRPFPSVHIYGYTKNEALRKGIQQIFVSISHDGDLCITIAIAVG